jgi:hypothetical protein
MIDVAELFDDVPLVGALEVPVCGATRLAGGILEQAIRDVRNGHGEGCVGHRELVRACELLDGKSTTHRHRIEERARALLWVWGFCGSPRCRRDHSEELPFPHSFTSVCEVLRLDADEVRMGLVRWDLHGCVGAV